MQQFSGFCLFVAGKHVMMFLKSHAPEKWLVISKGDAIFVLRGLWLTYCQLMIVQQSRFRVCFGRGDNSSTGFIFQSMYLRSFFRNRMHGKTRVLCAEMKTLLEWRGHPLLLLLGHFRWGQLRWGSAQPHSYIPPPIGMVTPSGTFLLGVVTPSGTFLDSHISGCHICCLNETQVLNSFLYTCFWL